MENETIPIVFFKEKILTNKWTDKWCVFLCLYYVPLDRPWWRRTPGSAWDTHPPRPAVSAPTHQEVAPHWTRWSFSDYRLAPLEWWCSCRMMAMRTSRGAAVDHRSPAHESPPQSLLPLLPHSHQRAHHRPRSRRPCNLWLHHPAAGGVASTAARGSGWSSNDTAAISCVNSPKNCVIFSSRGRRENLVCVRQFIGDARHKLFSLRTLRVWSCTCVVSCFIPAGKDWGGRSRRHWVMRAMARKSDTWHWQRSLWSSRVQPKIAH